MSVDYASVAATTMHDLLPKSMIGDGTLSYLSGDTDDFIVPYRYPMLTVNKLTNFCRPQTTGFFLFQCIVQPPDLLSSYSNKEGIFTANEYTHHIKNRANGFNESTYGGTVMGIGIDGLKSYYDAYNPYISSMNAEVCNLRPFGITTTSGMNGDAKQLKTYRSKICIYGKLDHPMYLPVSMCSGLITKDRFMPVPEYTLYGEVYLYLAFDDTRNLKFFFTDNPALANLQNTTPAMYYAATLKVGMFYRRDMYIDKVWINDVAYYQCCGFVFCPDSEWKLAHNRNNNALPPSPPKKLHDFLRNIDL